MKNRSPSFAKTLCARLLGGLAVAAAAFTAACSPPPDTSPAVSIISPVNDQVLPAGQAIDVRFTVSGLDASGPTTVAFMLGSGSTMTYGRGKVRAYIDNSGFLAQISQIPNDAHPFKVPDGVTAAPADFVRPGRHRLTLILYYNDDSLISPQREGVVNINVQ